MSHLTQMLMANCVSQHSEFWEGPSHSGADYSSEDSVGGERTFPWINSGDSQTLWFDWLGPISKLDLLISQVGVVSLDTLKLPNVFLLLSFD